jgi:hypothetical protein
VTSRVASVCRHRLVVLALAAAPFSCGDDGDSGGGATSADATGTTGATSVGATGPGPTSASDTDLSTTDATSTLTGTATALDTSTSGGGDTTEGNESGSGSDTGIGGEANVLYVRSDGRNGNPGTIDAPMRTIQWATDQAVLLGTIDTIRVAEGEYSTDYANADHIVMIDGVSMYGGYRADWGDRDPSQYVSSIVDASPTTLASSEDVPFCAVEIPDTVAAATAFDGFRVSVAHGQFRTPLFVRGDASISNNTIVPVLGTDAVTGYGLRVIDGTPAFVSNRISFEVTGPVSFGTGIYASYSDGLYADNVIDMTGATYSLDGISLEFGSPAVLANSVWAPDVTNVSLIRLNGATPTLDNNVLETVDLSGVCVWSVNAASVPMAARNNVLDCGYTLFGSSPLRSWTTVMEFQTGLLNATDNLKLPAPLIDPAADMVLDGQTPCTVTAGGRDITAEVADDINANPRTVPLSIGAHEWDGGCQ